MDTNQHGVLVSAQTPDTQQVYLKEGRRILAQAIRKFPGAVDSVDALVRLFSNELWELQPSTTRLYRAQISAVILKDVENEDLDVERAREGLFVLSELLIKRRGRPECRGSRKKVINPTRAELAAVAAYVAQGLRKRTSVDLLETALLLLLALGPTLGLRPIEWTRAAIDEEKLTILNAKSTNGRANGPVREFLRHDLPPKVDQFAGTLIAIMKTLMERVGNWRRLLGQIAERLARICARLEIRRLCLYSLRHICLANSEAIGFSDAERAALAGHRSKNTARRHYAGAKHGWGPGSVVARPIASVLPASWPSAKISLEPREPDWILASRPSLRM